VPEAGHAPGHLVCRTDSGAWVQRAKWVAFRAVKAGESLSCPWSLQLKPSSASQGGRRGGAQGQQRRVGATAETGAAPSSIPVPLDSGALTERWRPWGTQALTQLHRLGRGSRKVSWRWQVGDSVGLETWQPCQPHSQARRPSLCQEGARRLPMAFRGGKGTGFRGNVPSHRC
jgi:hypothetical protein